MTLNRLAAFLAVIAMLGAAGCSPLTGMTASGPCELVVHTVDDDSTLQVLRPPYQIRSRPKVLVAALGPTDISFSGQGWGQTRVTVTTGGQPPQVEIVEGEDINGGFRGWILGDPGVWRFRLQSSTCLQEFAVEVTP